MCVCVFPKHFDNDCCGFAEKQFPKSFQEHSKSAEHVDVCTLVENLLNSLFDTFVFVVHCCHALCHRNFDAFIFRCSLGVAIGIGIPVPVSNSSATATISSVSSSKCVGKSSNQPSSSFVKALLLIGGIQRKKGSIKTTFFIKIGPRVQSPLGSDRTLVIHLPCPGMDTCQ